VFSARFGFSKHTTSQKAPHSGQVGNSPWTGYAVIAAKDHANAAYKRVSRKVTMARMTRIETPFRTRKNQSGWGRLAVTPASLNFDDLAACPDCSCKRDW
jgi:hypothetical protein